MFLFKKIVAPFFLPLPICMLIIFSGLILLWFSSRRQGTGKVLVTVGVLMLCCFSYGPTVTRLLAPLERAWPKYVDSPSIGYVVVLGSGHSRDAHVPFTSFLSDPGVRRLVEGIRIYRQHPGSKLVFSGRSVAHTSADLAVGLGVDPDDIVIVDNARDTKDEANAIRSVIRTAPFILVTSALHMPRSMALFQKQGMHPIPAPTRHFIKKTYTVHPIDFFPQSRNLYKSELAAHEYLGMAWAWLRGQI